MPRFVSVLIPAFNEERVIADSVRHILSSQGPCIKVIIIDDGSSDETAAVVMRAFAIDPRGLALFGLTQTWIFQIGFGLISPVIDLALIGSIVAAVFRLTTHAMDQSQGSIWLIAVFWNCLTAVDLLCCHIAYRLDGAGMRVPVPRLLMQRFGYRQLLYAVIVRAVIAALCGPHVGWGKLERSGRQTIESIEPELASAAVPLKGRVKPAKSKSSGAIKAA